jgi:hypothetical protein
MKRTTAIYFILLLIIGCNQHPKKEKRVAVASVSLETSTNKIKVDKSSFIEAPDSLKPVIKRWFEPSSLDTILIFSDSLQLVFNPHDSISFNEYFLDKNILDSLINGLDNSHRKALAIENYLIPRNQSFVKRDSLGLYLKLNNGEWKLLEIDPMTEEADHNFEHYFKDFGFYSTRVQWHEGNSYKLINSQNGEVTNLIGRPYFSPNGNYLISVNADIEAGYSDNGLQFFINKNGILTLIGAFDPYSWGPISAKWIDNNSLILIGETMEFIDNQSRYLKFYSQLKINTVANN